MIVWLICALTTCSPERRLTLELCQFPGTDIVYVGEKTFTCQETWYGFSYPALKGNGEGK